MIWWSIVKNWFNFAHANKTKNQQWNTFFPPCYGFRHTRFISYQKAYLKQLLKFTYFESSTSGSRCWTRFTSNVGNCWRLRNSYTATGSEKERACDREGKRKNERGGWGHQFVGSFIHLLNNNNMKLVQCVTHILFPSTIPHCKIYACLTLQSDDSFPWNKCILWQIFLRSWRLCITKFIS